MIQCNIYTKYIKRLTNTLRVWTFHCNCPYISHLKKELPDITATKLQMNFDLSQIWFSAIYAPNLSSVWQTLFEFETFQCNFPFISHFYEELPNIIATKHQIICDQSQIWIHCNKCTKFIKRLTNTLRVWTFHCNCSISIILMKNYRIIQQKTSNEF